MAHSAVIWYCPRKAQDQSTCCWQVHDDEHKVLLGVLEDSFCNWQVLCFARPLLWQVAQCQQCSVLHAQTALLRKASNASIPSGVQSTHTTDRWIPGVPYRVTPIDSQSVHSDNVRSKPYLTSLLRGFAADARDWRGLETASRAGGLAAAGPCRAAAGGRERRGPVPLHPWEVEACKALEQLQLAHPPCREVVVWAVGCPVAPWGTVTVSQQLCYTFSREWVWLCVCWCPRRYKLQQRQLCVCACVHS